MRASRRPGALRAVSEAAPTDAGEGIVVGGVPEHQPRPDQQRHADGHAQEQAARRREHRAPEGSTSQVEERATATVPVRIQASLVAGVRNVSQPRLRRRGAGTTATQRTWPRRRGRRAREDGSRSVRRGIGRCRTASRTRSFRDSGGIMWEFLPRGRRLTVAGGRGASRSLREPRSRRPIALRSAAVARWARTFTIPRVMPSTSAVSATESPSNFTSSKASRQPAGSRAKSRRASDSMRLQWSVSSADGAVAGSSGSRTS